jgi:predicted TPR repeat methyltransferase
MERTAQSRDGDRLEGAARFEINFPDPEAAARDQDQEWCEVTIDGRSQRLRLHDYAAIYSVPGLYEYLFYEELRCRSPQTVRAVLEEAIDAVDHLTPEELRVLDVGAGNGMVGEELDDLGAEAVVGVDIVEEAAQAVERDRPGVYDDYHVVDLTDVSEDVDRALGEARFNCLTSVAALGFGDIPPEAFVGAYDYVADGGLVGLSIKADFLSAEDRSGFAELISSGLEDGSLEMRASRRFVHRLSAAGEEIDYVALAAEKHGPLPV